MNHNEFWKDECSKLRYGTDGEIKPDLEAWEKAIQVYDQSWYWVYGWMKSGYPSPPAWFFKSRDEYLLALNSGKK